MMICPSINYIPTNVAMGYCVEKFPGNCIPQSKLLLYWAVSGEACYRKMSQNFEAAKLLFEIYLEAAQNLCKTVPNLKR